MNIAVNLVNGDHIARTDVTFTFDADVLQIVDGAFTTTFPLTAVISFTTSESVPS